MTKCITPIETEYKGYRFRSRLEARWAVFFDACGAEWEYEPEGFDLGNGLYYLPDFLLHNVWAKNYYFGDLWIEVKGKMKISDAIKIQTFCRKAPIIVLGNIPDDNSTNDFFTRMCWGEQSYGVDFFNFSTIIGDNYPALPGVLPNGHFAILGSDYDADDEATIKAYKVARQARFEHGENPNAKFKEARP